jgi:hypothetical protein
VSKPDLEALVTPKIAEAVQAAVDKVGRTEFEAITGVDDQHLASILTVGDEYVTVALVTLTCQINKSHGDPNPAHSSVTECLKGSTIRIAPLPGQAQSTTTQPSNRRPRLQKLQSRTSTTGPLYDVKTTRIIGFAANLGTFLILGYFLGGIAISPIIGEASCIGVSVSPPALSPCGGSLVGLVVSAIGGIGYTFYYFVKKL